MIRLALVLAACAPEPAPVDSDTDVDTAPPPWAGDGEAGTFALDLEVDGVDRSYFLHVPEDALAAMPDGPVPLLFGLHGAGDEGEHFVTATKLDDLADDNAFVVVGPDAMRGAWFLSAQEGWRSPDGNPTSLNNDLAFVLALIDELDAHYRIDHDRIFAAGFSRGAGFSGALATTSGWVETAAGTYTSPFAAHAISAGFDVFGGEGDFTEIEPKNPIWLVHGTSDTAVPFSYGETFAEDLEDAGWEATFTRVQGAPHNWLFQAQYGQDNQDLWDWCLAAVDE